MQKDQRIQALEKQNAQKYFELCSEYGIAPEDSSLYEQGALEVQLERERELREDPAFIFLKQAEKLSHETFKHTDEKRRLLGILYANLKGPGKRIPLEECSPSRIGHAFKNTYSSLCKKLRA